MSSSSRKSVYRDLRKEDEVHFSTPPDFFRLYTVLGIGPFLAISINSFTVFWEK